MAKATRSLRPTACSSGLARFSMARQPGGSGSRRDLKLRQYPVSETPEPDPRYSEPPGWS